MATPAEIRKAAIALLTRRDHSRRELSAKLIHKGFPPDMVDHAVAALAAEGLQSDLRFAEGFVRSARGKGYGLVRIRASLRERGVEDAIIDAQLVDETDWPAELERVRRKRFGAQMPQDGKEWAKQARFLQYRGFSAEQIRKALKQNDWD